MFDVIYNAKVSRKFFLIQQQLKPNSKAKIEIKISYIFQKKIWATCCTT